MFVSKRVDKEACRAKEKLEPCDVLGISCVTPNAEFGGQLADAWPAKVKVAGGPHVTYILEGPHAKFKHRD